MFCVRISGWVFCWSGCCMTAQDLTYRQLNEKKESVDPQWSKRIDQASQSKVGRRPWGQVRGRECQARPVTEKQTLLRSGKAKKAYPMWMQSRLKRRPIGVASQAQPVNLWIPDGISLGLYKCHFNCVRLERVPKFVHHTGLVTLYLSLFNSSEKMEHMNIKKKKHMILDSRRHFELITPEPLSGPEKSCKESRKRNLAC